MAEFEETQPEETKTDAPTRLETLKMSLTEYAESTKSYTTEKYEKTKTLVNESVVEPYARARVGPRRSNARTRIPRSGRARARVGRPRPSAATRRSARARRWGT